MSSLKKKSKRDDRPRVGKVGPKIPWSWYRDKPELLMELPPETLMSAPVEILENLGPQRLVNLPREILEQLSPRVLMDLPPTTLCELSPETLSKLPATSLTGLNGTSLAMQHPMTLAKILRKEPSVLGLLDRDLVAQRLRALGDLNLLKLNLPGRVLDVLPMEYYEQIPYEVWSRMSTGELDMLPEHIRGVLSQRGTGVRNWSTRRERSGPASPRPPALDLAQSQLAVRNRRPVQQPSAVPSSPKLNSPLPPTPLTEPTTSFLGDWLDRSNNNSETVQIARIGDLKSEMGELTNKVIRLEAERLKDVESVRIFLQSNSSPDSPPFDESQSAVEQLKRFCLKNVEVAASNFSTAQYWQKRCSTAEANYGTVHSQVTELTARLQQADQAVVSLQQQVDGLRGVEATLVQWKERAVTCETQLDGLQRTFEARVTERKAEWEAKIAKLEKDLERQKKASEQEIDRLRKEHDNLVQAHQLEMQHKDAEIVARVEATRQHYASELDVEIRKVEQQMVKLNNNHAHNVKELKERVKFLTSSLVDEVDDFRPATDDSLMERYKQIALDVQKIPFNLGTISIPPNSPLDPTGFLQQQGAGHYLLQSLIWQTLTDGFFSAPFGLGALGRLEGKQKLIGLVIEWRKLIQPETLAVTSHGARKGDAAEQDSIRLFRNNLEANKWRSATFQSMIGSLRHLRGAKANPGANGNLGLPYFENRDKVLRDILDIINQLCVQEIPEQIEETIESIVQLAAELALDFGAHRAELGLEMPVRGSTVEIGTDFVDYRDSDDDRGQFVNVVLTVLPRLYKTGDGRGDMKTSKVIWRGEIYPSPLEQFS